MRPAGYTNPAASATSVRRAQWPAAFPAVAVPMQTWRALQRSGWTARRRVQCSSMPVMGPSSAAGSRFNLDQRLCISRRRVHVGARIIRARTRCCGRVPGCCVTAHFQSRGAIGTIVTTGMMKPRTVVRSSGSPAIMLHLLRGCQPRQQCKSVGEQIHAAGSLLIGLSTSVGDRGYRVCRQQLCSTEPRVV